LIQRRNEPWLGPHFLQLWFVHAMSGHNASFNCR
jgi:hypothetical protein